MSAVTTAVPNIGVRPTFARITRSEWIKLRSLRSTLWTTIATVVVMAGFAALFAWALTSFPDGPPADATALTIGYPIAQLTVAALGALVVTGEFSTGAHRSTLAAEPRRLRVVLSKGLIVLGAGLGIGLLAVGASLAVALPIFQAGGVDVELSGDAIRALVGTVLYLAVSALFAYGVGLIVRNSAAAITTTVGLLFVLPIIVQIAAAMTGVEWLANVYEYLPSTAGSAVTGMSMGGAGSLEPWTGFAVFGAYTAALLVAGSVAFSRRDD